MFAPPPWWCRTRPELTPVERGALQRFCTEKRGCNMSRMPTYGASNPWCRHGVAVSRKRPLPQCTLRRNSICTQTSRCDACKDRALRLLRAMSPGARPLPLRGELLRSAPRRDPKGNACAMPPGGGPRPQTAVPASIENRFAITASTVSNSWLTSSTSSGSMRGAEMI